MTQIHTPHLRGIPGEQDGTQQHNTKTQTNKAEVTSVDPPFPMYTTWMKKQAREMHFQRQTATDTQQVIFLIYDGRKGPTVDPW